jgi:hypothetical protein
MLKAEYVLETNTQERIMVGVWCVDVRYIFEQLIYLAAILFVGAKFFEGRTILTVGFDKLDKDKMIVKGPDDENVVWVGHRYGSKLEAQAIAEALDSRLEESEVA